MQLINCYSHKKLTSLLPMQFYSFATCNICYTSAIKKKKKKDNYLFDYNEIKTEDKCHVCSMLLSAQNTMQTIRLGSWKRSVNSVNSTQTFFFFLPKFLTRFYRFVMSMAFRRFPKSRTFNHIIIVVVMQLN